MATWNHVLDAIERHLDFPRSRSTGIARRLQEAGILPSGAPGVAPELDEDNVLDLVVALASDTELHTAVDAVRAYHAMTPGSVNLDGAPQSIPNAPIAVAILVEDARTGVAEARKSQVAVSCNCRAVAIHRPDGSVSRFSQPGAHCAHWQSNGHHKSVTINVAAVAGIIDALFGKVVA
ncbi:hypothetical protein [Bradyrhizobium elkanii]|uniref:hypothetical protein n=1 Tax=Bradyrhizobium elkanii TaxID=29448 RepID=UPI001AE6D3D3|nr:hypothetical protein [Bradyrhizobium elkanii]MBP2429974.1 hypothetical protein [Bradyrhizobium elkanii]MCP1973511.1 hypothetical protein [Bradyrhizobium elkanii]MCS4104982.1 hypothetical protein [Bradyrhizobium elkanii]WLA92604.1 hypothetical protein QNJ96_04570 [Bradyrhizobium elkanii]